MKQKLLFTYSNIMRTGVIVTPYNIVYPQYEKDKNYFLQRIENRPAHLINLWIQTPQNTTEETQKINWGYH